MVYVPPHELRHDELAARAARTLREVEAGPDDWLEGPRRRPVRLELEGGGPLERLARSMAARIGAGLFLVGLVVVAEALR
jgi:hypothetical protein